MIRITDEKKPKAVEEKEGERNEKTKNSKTAESNHHEDQ